MQGGGGGGYGYGYQYGFVSKLNAPRTSVQKIYIISLESFSKVTSRMYKILLV
jgi:hypothetical protein